ncbi:MAG: glycosyltransferase family 4 protein [Acidilobus sp.]
MRIALVHTLLFVAGGAERLAIEAYRALEDLGHDVDLYAAYVDERAWQILTSGMGNIPRPRVLGEPPISKLLRNAMTLRSLLAASHLKNAVGRLRSRYDLVIETQTNVPVGWADACYMQSFPLAGLLTYYINIERLKLNLRERAYNSLIAWIARTLADKTKPIIANSSWIAEHVKRIYGNQRVYVVHPPVNVEELSSLGGDRGRIVLTVSRIDWVKKVWEIPDIARLVPEADFYLVGSTGPSSKLVLNLLEERAKGLKNFNIETDVPRKRIIELMSQASIYLHPPHAEHFGIAIAEAAAAGLVPVVYRDGGGWTDIASRIDERLGYTSVEEAAHIIRSLLNDARRLKELSSKAREVAKGFGYERFKIKLNEVIKELARSKAKS